MIKGYYITENESSNDTSGNSHFNYTSNYSNVSTRLSTVNNKMGIAENKRIVDIII